MRRFLKAGNILICLIIAAAFLARLYIVLDAKEPPAADGLDHDRIALCLLSGKGYMGEEGAPTSLRPPLYPFMLALVYSVSGHHYIVIRVLQAIIGSASVFLFYRIGCMLYSKKVGLAAAFMSAIYPSYLILTKHFFNETLFTFLLALSIYIFLKARDLLAVYPAILLGMVLGFTSLTKSSALALPAVYIIAILALPHKSIKRALVFITVLLIAYAATLTPWAVRNYIVHQRPVIISSNGGLNFYQAVSPIDEKIFGKIPEDENITIWKSIPNEADRDTFLYRKGWEKIFHQPARAVKLIFMRMLFYCGFFDWEVQSGREYNYIYGFILPFFIYGLIASLPGVRRAGILLWVIFYFLAVILVSQGAVRYRLPTDGLIFIIGSFGIYDIMEKTKGSKAVFLLIVVYFMANCLMYLNSAHVRNFFKLAAGHLGIW